MARRLCEQFLDMSQTCRDKDTAIARVEKRVDVLEGCIKELLKDLGAYNIPSINTMPGDDLIEEYYLDRYRQGQTQLDEDEV